MENVLEDICSDIADRIVGFKDKILPIVRKFKCSNSFSDKRLLYHIICDSVFDGTAFDFFEDKKLFCTSKKQVGNRDYLIVAYEDCAELEINSNKILCSSNNYNSSGVVFNSFGDSDGIRKDIYRFTRIFAQNPDRLSSVIDLKNISSDILLKDINDITSKCAELSKKILNDKLYWSKLDKENYNIASLLFELGYITHRKDSDMISLVIPVFYSYEKELIFEVSNIVLNEIYDIVKLCFDNFSNSAKNLSAVKHEVNIKELGNELWHQIFGFTNEILVKCEFVQKPMYIENEGRYLRSILIDM